MATNSVAQERGGQTTEVLEWLGEPERRLHSKIADLVKVEFEAGGMRRSKSSATFESQQFAVGDWSATTTFHVVDGRVKRLQQEAVTPLEFCDEASNWGVIGLELRNELGVDPMVYVPTYVSGLWQQAALWHANRMTVVLYRTLAIDGECRVRMSAQ